MQIAGADKVSDRTDAQIRIYKCSTCQHEMRLPLSRILISTFVEGEGEAVQPILYNKTCRRRDRRLTVWAHDLSA